MNRSLLLHVVERLEGFVGKLPATIQKPILSELTPLKELFLQQRPARLLVTGAESPSIREILDRILPETTERDATTSEIYSWTELILPDRGSVFYLDARGADAANAEVVQEELKRQTADVVLFVDDCQTARGPRKIDIDNLDWAARVASNAKIVGIACGSPKRNASDCAAHVRNRLDAHETIRSRLSEVFDFTGEDAAGEAKRFQSLLARELPNEARIEMIRISQDKEAQRQVAQTLIKSTTAICTAVGTQPIPLADLPFLTTLQLVMVSGIMYVSGRERSLRAATEFVGALGVNVGAGMLLREGARAILKFFPGWGNIVCGAVAGAGTYAIGRAAIVYFLEGLTLKDARRAYLSSRKKRSRPDARPIKEIEAAR